MNNLSAVKARQRLSCLDRPLATSFKIHSADSVLVPQVCSQIAVGLMLKSKSAGLGIPAQEFRDCRHVFPVSTPQALIDLSFASHGLAVHAFFGQVEGVLRRRLHNRIARG